MEHSRQDRSQEAIGPGDQPEMDPDAPAGEKPDLYVPIPARVCDVRPLTPTECLLRLRLLDGRPIGHVPGQFVQISIFGLEEAPISICSAESSGPEFELCVRRVGRLTQAIHELGVGQEVGIRGPFGRGFPIEQLGGEELLCIAGGLGMAPMRSLIQWALSPGRRVGKVTLLYGGRQPSEMLFREEFPRWRAAEDLDLRLIVEKADAGWAGPTGTITELIEPVEIDPDRTVAVVVGPPVMYRFVIDRLTAKGLAADRIFLSLERHMRCGVGKCGHCMIDDLYCCRDGPVFRWSQLAHLKGVI